MNVKLRTVSRSAVVSIPKKIYLGAGFELGQHLEIVSDKGVIQLQAMKDELKVIKVESKSAKEIMDKLSEAVSDLKMNLICQDPGLLAAWIEAQEEDPDIGFLDVAQRRRKERELDRAKPSAKSSVDK